MREFRAVNLLSNFFVASFKMQHLFWSFSCLIIVFCDCLHALHYAEELFGTGEFKSDVADPISVTSQHLSSSIEDLKLLFHMEIKVLKHLQSINNTDLVKEYKALIDYE